MKIKINKKMINKNLIIFKIKKNNQIKLNLMNKLKTLIINFIIFKILQLIKGLKRKYRYCNN